MAKEKLPDIQRFSQWKWMKNTLTKELIGDGTAGTPKHDIGTANEIRLIRVIELVDWYIDNFGTPYRDYMPEDK